jgi:hypothetical protein
VISKNRINRNMPEVLRDTAAYQQGGGIYCTGADARILGNDIRGNLSGQGAGIYAYGGVVVAGNILVANNASASGGGLYLRKGNALNNTLVGNTALNAGGIYLDSLAPSLLAMASNNIIAYNSSGVAADYYGSGVTLTHNCIFGNDDYDMADMPQAVSVEGNIRRDPLLASVTWGDVHIQPDSPCRDAGDDSGPAESAVDMDGEPRVQGGRVDIGADESDGTRWTAVPRIVRVRPGGDDQADGASWASAKRTASAALETLKDSGGEVWVAEGRYAPVSIGPYIQMYGGFDGTESEREQRDWGSHPTVFDGAGEATAVAMPAGLRVSVLDGFVVLGGMSAHYGAAGVNAPGSAAPIITHNVIRDNVAIPADDNARYMTGGVLAGGNALVTGHTILGNSSSYVGGVASLGQHLTFRNNTVIGNSGPFGGGIQLNYPYRPDGPLNTYGPLLENNLITFNTSGLQMAATSSARPVLRNNNFFGNHDRDFVGTASPVGKFENLAVDPQIASFAYGGFHLTETSPCRDAGASWEGAETQRDIDGKPRVQGGRVDIGADEFGDPAPAITPRIVRVRWNPDASGDGSSWNNAVGSIQRAIDLASPAGEVWVAQGTYSELIHLRPYVYLYGGFQGNETQRDQRVVQFNRATVDGGQEGSVVTATGLAVYAGLDGFQLRNGRTDGSGGGMSCVVASPTITNNQFLNNRAAEGGGISALWSAARIVGNDLRYNIADIGGAIAVSGTAGAVIERNNIISNNASSRGGGLAGDASAVIVRDNLFARNAGNLGGAIYIGGSDFTVGNNTIVDNLSLTRGSAAVIWGSSPLSVNNIVAFNSAGLSSWSTARNYVYGNADFDYPGSSTGDLLDPLFVNRAGGDYRLLSASPAVDTGQDSAVRPGDTDLDGNPRIQGLRVDMGAYESRGIGTRFQDAVDALRISGGLDSLNPEDLARLDIVDGASAGVVDVADAVRLLRRSMGMDVGG